MDISTVNELLLSLLRGTWDESALRELPEEEWDSLVRQARRHALEPLLYHRLKTAPHVPAGVLQTLRTIYFEAAWRNAKMYNELAKVLTALRQAEIPVIVLKGAYLAQIVYSNIALRSMCDVDILVRKTDLQRAMKTLIELGYASSSEEDIEAVCARQQHLHPLMKNGEAAVEIHWTLVPPRYAFAIDADGLWNRARPCTIAGVEVLTLSPEDLLLHLCLHTHFHFYKNIKACCDIRETVRHFRNEIDWEAVQSRALQWGCTKAVYFTLHVASTLFGAKMPDEMLTKLRPNEFTPQMAEDAKKVIFTALDTSVSSNQYLAQFFDARSALNAAVLLLSRIFLSPEEMAQQYRLPPDSLRIFLCYPVHLKDLLVRHCRTVWRFLRRDQAIIRQLHLTNWLRR